jgi:hypothetical protein
MISLSFLCAPVLLLPLAFRTILLPIRFAQGAYIRDPQDGSSPTLRTELADLQTVLRRSRHDLATAERALAGLLARLPAEEEPR